MNRRTFVLVALSLVALSIYLFVSAPPPLSAGGDTGGAVPIALVLETVAAENDVVRALYTKEIVGEGKARGLRFDEAWRDAAVQAGPLPALFLREASGSIRRSKVPLGLFLGSDFPIVAANKLTGRQATVFERVRASRRHEIFFDEEGGRYTAMFPDVAAAEACVECHNQHSSSPKTDWKLNDVMGATTWSYPKATVSWHEYLEIVATVRQGFRHAYSDYLKEVETFTNKPAIGEGWPKDGFNVPSVEVFMAEHERRASAATVGRLLTNATAAPR